jgi:aspartate racemase
VKLIAPPPPAQAEVMALIRKIKTSQYGPDVTTTLQAVAEHLVQDGAGVLLAACTEISIIAGSIRTSAPLLDAAQILAETIVRMATSSG